MDGRRRRDGGGVRWREECPQPVAVATALGRAPGNLWRTRLRMAAELASRLRRDGGRRMIGRGRTRRPASRSSARRFLPGGACAPRSGIVAGSRSALSSGTRSPENGINYPAGTPPGATSDLQARQALKASVIAARSRFLPMKTSVFWRASAPHSRSNFASKSMCTPWKTRRLFEPFTASTPFMR